MEILSASITVREGHATQTLTADAAAIRDFLRARPFLAPVIQQGLRTLSDHYKARKQDPGVGKQPEGGSGEAGSVGGGAGRDEGEIERATNARFIQSGARRPTAPGL